MTTDTMVLDIFGAVEELHSLSAKELNKLLRDSQHRFTLRLRTGRGLSNRVDLEKLVLGLPLHLLACIASRGSEPRWRYLLRGVRLLHSLSDLALRHPKLEQIFLQEVRIREQVLDLIVYLLITLGSPEQEGKFGSSFTVIHAALVACTLHLLPVFVAAEWSDIVPVLLVHPKVDIFMDVAFDAVRRDVGLLHSRFRVLNSKLTSNKVTSTIAETMAQVIGQQCEASVQVLQSLCQPQAFRDRLLNHKELCKNGGILRLGLAVLKLELPELLAESKYLDSLISRLKSKMLAIMVKFCETESVSFLDEIAADAKTMSMAEMVASEVLLLVKKALLEDPTDSLGLDPDEEMPSGLLYIHALQLADIFSDDSNFRNSVMDHIASDLAKVLAQTPNTFLMGWCGSFMKNEEIRLGSDASLIYDPFRAAGTAMQSFKSQVGGSAVRILGGPSALVSDDSSGCSLSAGHMQFAAYSQERSSLFVKILANLHCFNPDICPADEKDQFLNLFIECLVLGPLAPGNHAFFLSTVQTAVRICENLFSLVDHVSSLSSEMVSDEDLQLVSTFYYALHDAICPSMADENSIQEDPIVAYVRDAHEQKRKTLFARWQQSDRWHRIHHPPDPSDKEQSNAGSSINRTTTKTSSSQLDAENDCYHHAECQEDQSVGDHSLTKRKRELQELEEESMPARRNETGRPFESKPMDFEWMRQEGYEIYSLKDEPRNKSSYSKSISGVLGVPNEEDAESAKPESGEYDPEIGTQSEMDRIVRSNLEGRNADLLSTKQECSVNEEGLHLAQHDDKTFGFGMKVEDGEGFGEARAADRFIQRHILAGSSEMDGVADVAPISLQVTAADNVVALSHCQLCMDVSRLDDAHELTGPLLVNDEAEIKDVSESPQSSTEISQACVREENIQALEGSELQISSSGPTCREFQPKKRKRSIMSEQQIRVMEATLSVEPEMQKSPELIMHWTKKLNAIGPEISYQQLKNWINNRKAKLARQAYNARWAAANSAYNGSVNGLIGPSPWEANIRESNNSVQINKASASISDAHMLIQSCFDVAANAHSGTQIDRCGSFGDIGERSGTISSCRTVTTRFVKCELGQGVTLVDRDGKEIAFGVVHQVEGDWQGKQIHQHGMCLVKITTLNIDKKTSVPYPSLTTGTTFEEAEKILGKMIVAWDTKQIYSRNA